MSRMEKKFTMEVIRNYMRKYDETHNPVYLNEALKMKRWMDMKLRA